MDLMKKERKERKEAGRRKGRGQGIKRKKRMEICLERETAMAGTSKSERNSNHLSLQNLVHQRKQLVPNNSLRSRNKICREYAQSVYWKEVGTEQE